MRTAIAGALAAALLPFVGCATATRPDGAYRVLADLSVPVIPPPGLLYTSFRAPLSLEATSFGPKTGRAVSHQIGLPPLPFPGLYTGLDLVAWGDASEKAASRNGGIAQVEHADYELTVVFFVYRRFTTHAYGN